MNTGSIPTEITEFFEALGKESYSLRLRWQMYCQLYGADQRRVDLLNWAAPVFFYVVENELFNGTCLAIARLLDPTRTGGKAGKENLVLGTLVEKLEQFYPGTTTMLALDSKLNALKDMCDPVIKRRMKLLAHNDLQAKLNPVSFTSSLPGISRADVEKMVQGIGDFLNVIQLHFAKTSTWYNDVLVPLGSEQALIEKLERLRGYEKLCGPIYKHQSGEWALVPKIDQAK